MAADHFLHNSCEGGHSGHTFGRLTSTEKLAEPPRPRRAASRPHCKERWDRTQGMGELPLKGGWAIPAVWHGRQGGLVKVLCCDQIHQDLCFTREDSHLKKSEKPLLELPVFSSISSTWGQAVHLCAKRKCVTCSAGIFKLNSGLAWIFCFDSVPSCPQWCGPELMLKLTQSGR